MNFIFDLETSGLPKSRSNYKDIEAFDTSRIVSISWILSQGDKIVEQSYFVIKPDNYVMSPGAQAVHGISIEQAMKDGIFIDDMFKELDSSLDDIDNIISYNIEFDINVLRSELVRYGKKKLLDKVNNKHHICCMKKAKEFLKTDKYPKLQNAYKSIFNTDMQDAHHAMSDTLNCHRLYSKMFPLSKDIFFIKNRKVVLTPEQSTIVYAPIEMNLAVLASAGSGKTTTITARIKHLVNNNVPESSIMLTTFTRDSANDMKEKLFNIFGYQPDVKVGTIDSISKAATSKNKDELKHVSEHAENYLTFIRKNPESIQKYSYMFIDEFQDINALQFDIIMEFSKNGAWIFVVGDDHQNIYSFRGSSIEYILNFKEYFPKNSDLLKLTYNFRSTREIINFANASIENNINQIPKKMVPGNIQSEPKPKPIIRYFDKSQFQVNYIVSQIEMLINKGISNDEIAVLSPLNQSLFLIEELLTLKNIRNVYLDGKSDVRTIKRSGHVCLCTIHKSKGLEWDYVFLTNMSDDLIPKMKTPKNIEESRRLFYVAVTRARLSLTITYFANIHTPYVTRYVSEISQELYDFRDFDIRYIEGKSENAFKSNDMSVTKLIENLQGDDYITMKKLGIMPIITNIEKTRIYEASSYLPLIEYDSLYSDFGTFMDVLISREISKEFDIRTKDKYVLQALACVTLCKSDFQIYQLYKNNFKSNIRDIEGITEKAQIIQRLKKNSKSINNEHIDIVISIIQQIRQNSCKFDLPMIDIPVFTERFLPNDFTSVIEHSLNRVSSYELDYNSIIDDVWEISKCHAIVKSYRRRLLYMDIKPSQHMELYKTTLFSNINKFIMYLKDSFDTSKIYVHEEMIIEEGIYGEFDLRVDDTIIDYKNSVNEDVMASWILQMMCYKTLYDMTHTNRIKKICIFNPLKGIVYTYDCSMWDKHKELVDYLIAKEIQSQ